MSELDGVWRMAELSCGNCLHWMKPAKCPREHRVGSKQGGPSVDVRACVRFKDDPITAGILF
jgi:hypothetical protein